MYTFNAYVAYYIGAYGDTIRIATNSKDWIILLKQKINDVLIGNTKYLDICKMSNIKCFDSICSLKLIKTKINCAPCVILRENEVNTFEWLQEAEEIEDILGLIDGLIADDSPGHQYLAYEDDGCVIELSYNEDQDDGMMDKIAPPSI